MYRAAGSYTFPSRVDPLYSARRTLHTGDGLLTDKQIHRLRALFGS